MYNWDIYEPPMCRPWDICGLLVYSESIEPNYDFFKLQATIPTYDDMGNPVGTETKLVMSGDNVKSMLLRKFWTFKFLTGKYYNYTTEKYEDLVTTVGGAWNNFKNAYLAWLNDNQVWVDKLMQTLSILDNPSDNYNKHLHSIMTYSGKEKDTMTPSGKETDTTTKTGNYTDNLTKDGKEKTTMHNAETTDTTYNSTFDSGSSEWLNKEKSVGTQHDDYQETEFGSGNTNRTDNRTVTYNQLKDTVEKEFVSRKDETLKEYLNRFDDYVYREWGNIGVTTYAQIVSGIFGVANVAQLGDFLIKDFVHRNCIK